MITVGKEGDLVAGMAQIADGIKGAVMRAARSAGRETQQLTRRETQAVLGQGVGNAWRLTVYPDRAQSLEPAAVISTKAPKIVDAFERGAPIRSPYGGMLAIPLPAAGDVRGVGRRKRLTPREWERRNGVKLRLVRRPGRASLLVADMARTGIAFNQRRLRTGVARVTKARYSSLEGRTSVPVFLLVPQVRAPKLLQIERYADAGVAYLALALAREVGQ